MKKKLTEGPFGIPMPDKMAKSLEALLKTLPQECRTLKRKGTVPDNVDLAPGERADISLVSVESIDREGEVVVAKGVDLRMFQQNPVVTFAHKYDELPVGRAAWIKQIPGALKAKTIYTTATETARACWQMTREGILRGKSIGFIPTRIRPPDKTETQWKNAAAVVESSLLLEYAIAPIPVNQNALVEAVAKGLADRATLQRLGLPLPTARTTTGTPIDEAALLVKALDGINIDPEEIVRRVLLNLKNRGRV